MLWKAVFFMPKTTIWFGWLILPIDLETQIASSHKFFPMRLLDPFLFALTSARTHTHVYMTLLPSFAFFKNTVPWGPAVPRGPLRLVRDITTSSDPHIYNIHPTSKQRKNFKMSIHFKKNANVRPFIIILNPVMMWCLYRIKGICLATWQSPLSTHPLHLHPPLQCWKSRHSFDI